MLTLAVEPLDLGPDVKAVGLSLTDPEDEEPVTGSEAARIWGRALPALAGEEPWTLDFFSHLDRVREFCKSHDIAFRDTAAGGVAVTETDFASLAELFERFESETFGVRAGDPVEAGDAELERELRHRGFDAYHQGYPRYLFCAICELDGGSVTLISERLWASEAARRLRAALRELSVTVEMLM
jgi:hypothetical protein